jgi:hypothetical protein
MDWADFAIKTAGLVVLIFGLLQLRETVRKRHIDLYWEIADRYLSEEGRNSRDAVAKVEEALGLSDRSRGAARPPSSPPAHARARVWKGR